MNDPHEFRPELTAAPARHVFAITPHASNEVNPIPKAIRANTAGTIAFRTVDSSVDVSLTLAAGEVLPIRVQFVRAIGTTATIHGFG